MKIDPKKSLNVFQYFVQKNLKNSMPENFPVAGSWVTIELREKLSNAKIEIPALLYNVNKRTLQVKTRIPFPDNCRDIGLIYCSFGIKKEEKSLFKSAKTVRHCAEIKVKKIVSKKTADLKLVDALFAQVNQREFERLPYKNKYNIFLDPVIIPEKDDKCVHYNLYMKNFCKNIMIKDIAPGGLGVECHSMHSKLIKKGHKFEVSLCFEKRDEHIFFKKLMTAKTVPAVIQTVVTVLNKVEMKTGVNFFSFKFKDVEKHRYYILDTSNRIRRSDAALEASIASRKK